MPDLGPGGRGGARRRTRRRQQAIHSPDRAASTGTAEPEYIGEIEKLAKLHDQGVLTDEEFAAKKAKLLEG